RRALCIALIALDLRIVQREKLVPAFGRRIRDGQPRKRPIERARIALKNLPKEREEDRSPFPVPLLTEPDRALRKLRRHIRRGARLERLPVKSRDWIGVIRLAGPIL